MISPFFSPTIGVLAFDIVHLFLPHIPEPAQLLYALWLIVDAIPTIQTISKKRRSPERP